MIDVGWILLQAVVGGLGALVRFGVMTVVRPAQSTLGLWVVNSAGSLCVGVSVGAYASGWVPWVVGALVVAFSAGLTTFSTLTVTVAHMLERGERWSGLGLLTAQLLGGIAIAVVGYIATIALQAAW